MTAITTRAQWYSTRPIERRMSPFEVREVDGVAVGLSGYASTYQPYAVRDFLGEYEETIVPGAFGKTLQERDDVPLLLNHEGIPLARTKSGTMTLGEDSGGLRVDVPTLDTTSPLVQTVRSALQRGDIDQMSFAFKATRQEWNEDYTQRTVHEVKLYDVSVVTYPANPFTQVHLNGQAPEGEERGWNPKTSDYTIGQWKSACAYHPASESDNYSDYKLPYKDPDGSINKTGLTSAGKMINHVHGDHGQLVKAAKKLVSAFNSEGMDVPQNVKDLAGDGGSSKNMLWIAELAVRGGVPLPRKRA